MCSHEDTFWHNTLDAFENQPGFATPMAINLAALRDMLKTKRGIREAIEILEDGIKLIYPHTDVHGASFKLYQRYIGRRSLAPSDDPLMIVERIEEAERKPKRKKSVKATKRNPALRLVKGKKIA